MQSVGDNLSIHLVEWPGFWPGLRLTQPIEKITQIQQKTVLSPFEGGVIMSRLYRKASTLADQVAQHKNYVELPFGLRD